MFSHVMVGANDIDASKAFYDATFQAIGGNPGFSDSAGRIVYMHNDGLFVITVPIDGKPACHANGGTIGLKMESPEQIDAWHKAGIAAGGTTCEDPPGIRDTSHGRNYLAYMRDPAGNKLCGVFRTG